MKIRYADGTGCCKRGGENDDYVYRRKALRLYRNNNLNQSHTHMKQNKKTLKKHADYRLAQSGNRVMIEFAKRMNVTPMEIIQHNKSANISDIRQLYCKLRHESHGVTYTATGRELDRSHTAVKYGVMHINDLLLMKDKKTVELWNKVSNISGYYL